MWNFFKQEEKRPFTYPSIEVRRQPTNYFVWILGIILLIAVGIVAFFIF